MIRLATVIDTFDLGGLELACLELLSRLDRDRFDPRIYTFRPGALVDRARDAGIPVVVGYDKPPMDREWREVDSQARERWGRELTDHMTNDGADICFTWGWPEAIEAARSAGVATIVERVDGPSLAARVVDKSACARVISESRMVRDLLLAQRERFGLSPKQVVLIRNGVDLERFDPDSIDAGAARQALGIPMDAFVVGTASRLSPEKNIAQVVAAFAAASKADASFAKAARLVLAGPDGGCREELEEQARTTGLDGRVFFTGAVSNVPALLSALDVFCLTSYTEGSPAAMLEAMAMALPIVTTPVGAVLEVLDGNAIVVDVMAPRETTNALLELFRDPVLRGRLGARSRHLARRYGIDRQVAHYERVLEQAWLETRAA